MCVGFMYVWNLLYVRVIVAATSHLNTLRWFRLGVVVMQTMPTSITLPPHCRLPTLIRCCSYCREVMAAPRFLNIHLTSFGLLVTCS